MITNDRRPLIVLVGGFLGAGKTTLILVAARELERRGVRSAIILNDQGKELVDTGLCEATWHDCGRDNGRGLLLSFVRPSERSAAVPHIFPRLDLCRTGRQLYRHFCNRAAAFVEYGNDCRLAPFTVLMDPGRAEELLGDDADRHLKFLFDKQIQEADLLCYTKSDLYPQYPKSQGRSLRQISAITGQGIAEWLDEILCGELAAGADILDIEVFSVCVFELEYQPRWGTRLRRESSDALRASFGRETAS